MNLLRFLCAFFVLLFHDLSAKSDTPGVMVSIVGWGCDLPSVFIDAGGLGKTPIPVAAYALSRSVTYTGPARFNLRVSNAGVTDASSPQSGKTGAPMASVMVPVELPSGADQVLILLYFHNGVGRTSVVAVGHHQIPAGSMKLWNYHANPILVLPVGAQEPQEIPLRGSISLIPESRVICVRIAGYEAESLMPVVNRCWDVFPQDRIAAFVISAASGQAQSAQAGYVEPIKILYFSLPRADD